jgi:glycosyltransferase involved in cell wall biosynthesis
VLYICVPAYNEAPTVGVLLWRIQKVFQDFAREYELIVYNDGSTDATGETLAAYADVLPLTVLGCDTHVGYACALDALIRSVSERCRYVRRDAIIVMQADFTDQPEHIPELVKRFEGGADVVVAESAAAPEPPRAVKRLRRIAPWLLRPFRVLPLPEVGDPFGSYRLFRVAVLRDALRTAGDKPLVHGDGWAANLDLLLAALPHARRMEAIAAPPRYDLRPRESRVRPWADALRLFRFGRTVRSRRPVAETAARA